MNSILKKVLIGAVAAGLVFGAGWWSGKSGWEKTTTETSHQVAQTSGKTDAHQQAASTTVQQTTTATADHSTVSTATSVTQNAKVTKTHTKVTKKDGTVIERDRETIDNSTHQDAKVDVKNDTTAATKTDTAMTATTDTTVATKTDTVVTTDTKKVTVEKPPGDHVFVKLYVEQDVLKGLKDKKLDVKTNLDVDIKVWGPVFVGGSVKDLVSKDRSYTARIGLQASF